MNTRSSNNKKFTKSEKNTGDKERAPWAKRGIKRARNTTIKHTRIQFAIGGRQWKEKGMGQPLEKR